MENSPGFDVFVSYAHADAGWVFALADALRAEGLRVWLDDAGHADAGIPDFTSIQRSIESGLARSRALVACYSLTYLTRRACQWELTAAVLLAQALDERESRVLVINPESSVEHIRPVELRDGRMVQLPDRQSASALATAARQIAAHAVGLRDRQSFGEIRRARDPAWYGRTRLGLDSFVGRTADLWDVHSMLRAPRHAIITGRFGRPVATVCGIGGQGKTMLANEYALRFGGAYPGGVFWLRGYGAEAGDTASGQHGSVLDAQLRRFASDRGLQVETADLRAVVLALRNDLGAAPPALWIVDDLPDGLSVEEAGAWLAPNEDTPTLLTTRSRAYDRLLRPVLLDRLPDQEGLELLTSRRPPTDAAEREKALEIVGALAGHSLALEVAGSWLAAGVGTYADYADDLREDPRDILELAADLAGELPTGHERSIARTLSHSVSALGDDGLKLLELGAVLSDAPIPINLLTRYFEIDGSVSTDLAKVHATRALADARRLSLVSGAATSPVVHALVSRAVRVQQKRNLKRSRGSVAAALRQFLEEGVDLSDVDQADWVCAHARALTRNAVTDEDAELLTLLAGLEDVRGNHRAADVAFAQLVDVNTKLRGAKHVSTLVARARMARAIGDGGDTSSGIRLLTEVLNDLREESGDEADETCRTEVMLASELRVAQRLDESKRLLEGVVKVYSKKYGPHHPATLIATMELASTLGALGELREALELQERASELLVAAHDIDEASTLAVMHNLAVTRSECGDSDGSIRLFKETLAARRRLLGEWHPDTVSTRTLLANEYRVAGRLQPARDLLEHGLRDVTDRLGSEHPTTLDVTNALTLVLFDQGEYDRAVALGQQAWAVSAAAWGETHPKTLTRAINLASFYLRAGRAAEALQLAEVTLSRARETLRETPDRYLVMLSCASILKRLGQIPAASDLQREAVDGLRATKGQRHPHTIGAMSNLAQTLFEQKHYSSAKELQEEVLSMNDRGADHPSTLMMKGNLASTLSHLGDYRRAAQMQQEVLDGQERVLGPGHPDTLLSVKKVAEVLGLCGDLTAEHAMLERGLERLGPGVTDPGIIEEARRYIDRVVQTDPAAMVAMESTIVTTLQRQLPPDSFEVLEARQSLVEAHVIARHFESACELGELTLGEFQRLRGPHDDATCKAVVTLASAYNARGMAKRGIDVLLSNLLWLLSRDPSTLTAHQVALRSQIAVIARR